MNAKRYLRGMLGQGWYNFTECLAWAILYRKMPEELEYCHKSKLVIGVEMTPWPKIFVPLDDWLSKKMGTSGLMGRSVGQEAPHRG